MPSMTRSQSGHFSRIASRKQSLQYAFNGASRSSREVFSICYDDEPNYSENYNGYHSYNGKADHITPLIDKLYGENRNDRSYLPSRRSSGNIDLLDIKDSHPSQDFVDDRRRWSIAKISILILIGLNLADIMLNMVDAQINALESHDFYDALSADVIRPAFQYQSPNARNRPSLDLGSAAISSVTSILSPILPFTGGIDLRREDYWADGIFGSISSVIRKTRDAFDESPTSLFKNEDSINSVLDTPRGGAAVSSKNRAVRKQKIKKNSRSKKNEFVLSNADCFVPLKEVADSTLKDVTTSFRYALESTQKDFNRGKFLSGLLPRVKKMMDRIATATTLARGKGVQPPITADSLGKNPSSVETGDIDALNFCAAMRIFAEWRVLRQVPPGYKGYAVGVGLGQKDIVQNIAKIEDAIHDYVDLQSNSGDDNDESNSYPNNGTNSKQVVTSPTLRELLQYEIDANVQDVSKLPRLKEKSAGMGLLWVKRQLLYQTEIFNNVLDVPKRFESSREAVQAAYDDVYGDLHGWAIQKIFSYSFQAAPEGIEIYKYMNLHRLQEVQQEARAQILGLPIRKKKKTNNSGPFSKLGNTPIGRLTRHIGNEWNKMACNVGNEVDKFTDNVGNNIGQLFGKPQQPKKELTNCETLTVQMDPDVTPDEAAKELEMESYISQEMRKDAYDHIQTYLEVVEPLLDNLGGLIDEFNMDDPTKV